MDYIEKNRERSRTMSPCLNALPSMYAKLRKRRQISVHIEVSARIAGVRWDVSRSERINTIVRETEGEDNKKN